MFFVRVPLLLALVHCAYSSQPEAPSPIAAPLRKLPWGQLNFLHTTDTHGWHGGHLQEAQYAADWGDYISFAHHLRQRADDDGSDLLLIDTGDRVEGNGLYDASDPKGKYTSNIINRQHMDVVTIGNHELYLQNTSVREFNDVVPAFKDSYLASNVDIYDPKTGDRTPMAARYRKFTTKNQGIRIVAFGFLFNFVGNSNNTVVQPVEKTVKEKWFQDALREKDVDLFLVAGHVPVRNSPELDAVYKAIRNVKWDTPIVFFGGHTHIRDYRKYEKKAFGIESGRYMETLGFLSISGLTGSAIGAQASAPEYKRMYLDNNLYSLHHHSDTNGSTFDTELGRNVSEAISSARQTLNLDDAFGCAPHDFWLNRAPYPSNDSLLTWLEQKVLPDSFENVTDPSIVITNSGAIRFDIFKGPFTVDSTFLVSPFTSTFRVLKDVPYDAASKVLNLLNNEDIWLSDSAAGAGKWQDLICALPPASAESIASTADGAKSKLAGGSQQILGKGKDNGLPGYTTTDDAGSDGDDTVHQPIRFYEVPNCIQSSVRISSADAEAPANVDLYYNEFIQNWVILALRYLGVKREVGDTQVALEGKTMTDVISAWVGEHWKCEE